MKRTNLRSQNITKRNRQVKTYGTQTPLSSAAVERGSTRWLDGSRVDIEGILNLIGTGNFSGTLNASGTNNFSGTNNLTGANHLVGPTDVAGNFEIISGGQFKAGDSLIYPDGSAKFGDLGIASDGTMQAGLFELRPDGSANFGTLEIEADGTLNVNNDINVLNDGKINVGTSMTLNPLNNGGSMDFANGTYIAANGTSLDIEAANSYVHVGSSGIDVLAGGLGIGAQLNLEADGEWALAGGGGSLIAGAGVLGIGYNARIDLIAPLVSVSNNLESLNDTFVRRDLRVTRNTYLATNPPTTAAVNTYIHTNGLVYISSSASRYKLDQKLMDLPMALLDVPMKDWVDRHAKEMFDELDSEPRPLREMDQINLDAVNLNRIPGVVAEDVEAAGGASFLTYGDDGQLETVSYDRLAMARTALLYARVAEVETKLAAITNV